MGMDDYINNIEYMDINKWKREYYDDTDISRLNGKLNGRWTINDTGTLSIDPVEPISWFTNDNKYYSSPFNPATIVSVDLADDSKKESKDTTAQDDVKNDDNIIEFDWDKMF